MCIYAPQARNEKTEWDTELCLSFYAEAFTRRVKKEGGQLRSHDRAIALVPNANGRTDDDRVRRLSGCDHRIHGRVVRRGFQWNSEHDQKRHQCDDALVGNEEGDFEKIRRGG
jgi:hypothetical protein